MGRSRTGRFLGLPYDFRRPNAARLKARSWNPTDRRVLVPKAFGWGLEVNLYEVLRRLRVIRGSWSDGFLRPAWITREHPGGAAWPQGLDAR